MRKFIVGVVIGSFLFSGIAFAREVLVDFSEENIPVFQQMNKDMWNDIDGKVTLTSVPATATSSGSKGEVAYDLTYMYICTDTDSWKRIAIDVWTIDKLLLSDGTSYVLLDDGISKLLIR